MEQNEIKRWMTEQHTWYIKSERYKKNMNFHINLGMRLYDSKGSTCSAPCMAHFMKSSFTIILHLQ